MPTILLGLAVLLILLWSVKTLARADPKGLVRGARLAGGVAALGGAAFLVARGQVSIGIPLGLTGLGLLGWLPFGPASFGQRANKAGGSGFAGSLRLPRNGARSRHRRHEWASVGGPTRGGFA